MGSPDPSPSDRVCAHVVSTHTYTKAACTAERSLCSIKECRLLHRRWRSVQAYRVCFVHGNSGALTLLHVSESMSQGHGISRPCTCHACHILTIVCMFGRDDNISVASRWLLSPERLARDPAHGCYPDKGETEHWRETGYWRKAGSANLSQPVSVSLPQHMTAYILRQPHPRSLRVCPWKTPYSS